jgi:ferrous iron transport protein A
MTISMNDLRCGQRGTVLSLGTSGGMRRRLLELGLVPGTDIERVLNSPGGDPACYRIRGAMIALRQLDATQVMVSV